MSAEDVMTPEFAARGVLDLLSKSGLSTVGVISRDILEGFLLSIKSPSTNKLLNLLNIDKHNTPGEDPLLEWFYGKYISNDFGTLFEVLDRVSGNNVASFVISSIVDKMITKNISFNKRVLMLSSAKSIVFEITIHANEIVKVTNVDIKNCDIFEKVRYPTGWKLSAIVKNDVRDASLHLQLKVADREWKTEHAVFSPEEYGGGILVNVNSRKIDIPGKAYEIKIDLFNNTATKIQDVVISLKGTGVSYPSKMIIIKEVLPKEYYDKSLIYVPRETPEKIEITTRYIHGGAERANHQTINLSLEDIEIIDFLVYHTNGLIQIFSLSEDDEKGLLVGGLITAANSILQNVGGGSGIVDSISLSDGYLHLKKGKNVLVALLSKKNSRLIDVALSDIVELLDNDEHIVNFRGKIVFPNSTKEMIIKVLSNYFLVPLQIINKYGNK